MIDFSQLFSGFGKTLLLAKHSTKQATKQATKKASSSSEDSAGVRLDKWLWAARFYKTRSIAREMIQGGKIRYNEQRTKPSKVVEVGAKITLLQGQEEKTVIIEQVSAHRRGAPEAQLLYSETDGSIKQREKNAEDRKNNAFFSPHPERKPDKKQRRQIIQFKSN